MGALLRMQKSYKSQSKSRALKAGSKLTSRDLQEALTYLRSTLPAGFQNFWTPRRYGRAWGIPIFCDICGPEDGRPPEYCKTTAQRQRWLRVHIRKEHV